MLKIYILSSYHNPMRIAPLIILIILILCVNCAGPEASPGDQNIESLAKVTAEKYLQCRNDGDNQACEELKKNRCGDEESCAFLFDNENGLLELENIQFVRVDHPEGTDSYNIIYTAVEDGVAREVKIRTWCPDGACEANGHVILLAK